MDEAMPSARMQSILARGSLVILWLLCLLCSAAAPAADVKLSGFGSVRVGQLESHGQNPQFPDFYTDDHWTFRDESLFALQIQTALNDRLGITVQWVARGRNDFQPETTWAFFSYRLNADHLLKVGRVTNPMFYQSDYDDVGYAHNFSRLPKAIYLGYSFDTIDGMSLEGTRNMGAYSLKYKAVYGNWDGLLYQSNTQQFYPTALNDVWSLNVELSQHWAKFFVGNIVLHSDFTAIDTQVVQPLALAAIANFNLTPNAKNAFLSTLSQSGLVRYHYGGVALAYGNWQLESEVSHYGVVKSIDAINKTAYLALGYRMDPVIVTLHREWFSQEQQNLDFIDGVTDPRLRAVATQLKAAIGAREYQMDVLSLRYDFHDSAALKADVFYGNDERPQVGRFHGVTLGVDFVF